MKRKDLVEARVISITDGDTFKVNIKGRESIIRIACIDAPEMSDDPWGEMSKDALTGMIKPGSKVKLLKHDSDRYGRTVAEVFRGKGKNIGLQLVKKGYAEVYEEYAYQCDEDRLTKFENKAKRKGKGIWDDSDKPKVIDEDDSVKNDFKEDIPPYSGSRAITCSQLSSQREAKGWLEQGHTYLDTDGDGIPCESLPLG